MKNMSNISNKLIYTGKGFVYFHKAASVKRTFGKLRANGNVFVLHESLKRINFKVFILSLMESLKAFSVLSLLKMQCSAQPKCSQQKCADPR